MGLFEINRESQVRICNHGEPRARLHTAKKGECYYQREKEVGRAKANKESMAFNWLCPCQERRGVFLLPVGLGCHDREGELSLLGSQIYLTEVSVY